MRIDPLAIAGKQRQFFLYRLLLVETGLARVEQRCPDHHVGEFEAAQHKGIGAVAVQRCADEARRLGMPIEQHVLPRDQHVIKDDERVDLVEAVGERVILDRGASARLYRETP